MARDLGNKTRGNLSCTLVLIRLYTMLCTAQQWVSVVNSLQSSAGNAHSEVFFAVPSRPMEME